MKRAEEFRWSSYAEYLHGRKGGALTDTDETLSFFSKQRVIAVRKCKEFVEGGIEVKTLLQDTTGSVLGGEAFREKVLKRLRVTADKAGIPEIKKIERTHEIKDIVMGVAGYYGLAEEEDRCVFIKDTEWQEEC